MDGSNSNFTIALTLFAVSLALFDVAFYVVTQHPELFGVSLRVGG